MALTTQERVHSQYGQDLRDLLLVALTVASGAVDAISYFGLGKIFSAFMTGNIVFLGFGIAEIEGPDVIPVIIALSTFAVGSYLGLRITTLGAQEPGLWPRRVTALLTLVVIAEASFLAVWLATAGHPPTEIVYVLLALFSWLWVSRPQRFDRSACRVCSLQPAPSPWSHSRKPSRDPGRGPRSRAC
jgi:uncharacterized membrane protein YoaK (UPF0700 family)